MCNSVPKQYGYATRLTCDSRSVLKQYGIVTPWRRWRSVIVRRIVCRVKPTSNEPRRMERHVPGAHRTTCSGTVYGAGPARTRQHQTGTNRQPHNPKVAGSNPAPATKEALGNPTFLRGFFASGVGREGPCQTCVKHGASDQLFIPVRSVTVLPINAVDRSAWIVAGLLCITGCSS